MLRFDRRCKGNLIGAQQISEQVMSVNFAPNAKIEHNRIYGLRLNKVNRSRVNNPAQFMTHGGGDTVTLTEHFFANTLAFLISSHTFSEARG